MRTYQITLLSLLQRYQCYSRKARLCKFELEIAREAAPFVDPAVLVETYEQEECVDDLEGDDRIQSALAHIVTHALLKMLLDLQVEEAFDFCGTPEGDLVHPAECMRQLPETVRRHIESMSGWQRKLDPRFHEGLLSSKQGAYIAESIAAKNMEQAKSRFRMYEDATDHGGSNHSAKVEPANGCTGERETGKSAKKLDKGRTAKEEASKREKLALAESQWTELSLAVTASSSGFGAEKRPNLPRRPPSYYLAA
ncbi:unnamed protein product [Prunus armeniaca]